MSMSSRPVSDGPISDGGGALVIPVVPTFGQLLESGDYVVAVEQRFATIGASYQHVMILGTTGFTTRATDTVPSHEVAPILDGDILISREIAITETTSLVGDQSGDVQMQVPATGVYLYTAEAGSTLERLTIVQAQRQCAGQPCQLKIGRSEWGYDSFYTVGETFAEALEPDGTARMRLRLRDQGRTLDQGLLATWAGTGGEEGTEELTGEVRPRHYGAARNVTLRQALPATLTYHASDRDPTSFLPAVYDGGVVLEEDDGGYPFADWADFQAHPIASGAGNTWVQYKGWVRVRTLPLGVLTADFADVMTVPEIMRAALVEAGTPDAGIWFEIEDFDYGADNSRSEEWQAFGQMLLTAPAQQYIVAQENVMAFIDRLAKTHGLSRYQDRDGRICFSVLDYRLHPDAVEGVDYLFIAPSENIEITPDAVPSSLWPPPFRQYVLADQNHTVMTQDQVFPDAADAFRQLATVPGRTLYEPDVTPANSPIKAGLPTAVDPPRNDTALVLLADAKKLGEWFQLRSALTRTTGSAFLSKRAMFKVRLPLSLGYAIPFMSVLKFRVPGYWSDGDLNVIGQLLPPTENWSTKMMEFDFYPYGFTYASTFLAEARPGDGKLDGPSGVFVTGDHAYVVITGGLAIIDVSDPTDPAWVIEIQGPVPGTSMAGATNVIVDGDFAFVTCAARASLAIIDVSNPAAPTWVTEMRGPVPGSSLYAAAGLSIDGSYAYIACGGGDVDPSHKLAIIDISTLSAPVWVAETKGPTPNVSLMGANGVHVSGGYAYVACAGRDSLAIINVSNPSAPAWVTEIRGPVPGTSMDGAVNVVVSGDFAFVTCPGRDSLATINVSNPAAPVWVAEARGPLPGRSMDSAFGLAVAGGYAYVTLNVLSFGDVRPCVAIIDVADPTAPAWVAEIPAGLGATRGICISGGYAYVACNTRDALAVIG